VKNKLLDAELKMKESSARLNAADASSFYVQKRKCYNCGSTAHLKKDCTYRNNKGASQNGTSANFRRKKKFNKSANLSSNVHEEKNDEIVFNAISEDVNNRIINGIDSSDLSIDFILDSGASDHYVTVGVTSYLSEVFTLDMPVKIKIANGKALISNTRGQLTVFSNGRRISLSVLVVPDLSHNLLSVKKLTDAGNCVTFSKGIAEIKNSSFVKRFRSVDGIFVGRFQVHSGNKVCNVAVDGETWHRRLDPCDDFLKRLGLPVAKETCGPCFEGKAKRLPFRSVISAKSNKKGEMLHTDIAGPVREPSLQGEKYYQVVVDDFTHFVTVYILQNKSQAEAFLMQHIRELEADGFPCSRIRCDNGGEFKSHRLVNFCNQKGIKLEYTLPYSPQENGVSERINFTLMSKVRTIFAETNLPKYLWNEVIRTVAYQLNRTPTSTLKGAVPAELYYGKLDLSKLRVCGSKTWACKIPTPSNKLDTRAIECYLVGYSRVGYRLWDPISNNIIISRDVRMDEKDFRYHPEKDRPQCIEIQEANDNSGNSEFISGETSDSDSTSQDEDIHGNPPSTKTRTREIKIPRDYQLYSAYCFISGLPSTFDEAMTQGNGWPEAIGKEIQALENNNVWTSCILPIGIKPIDTRWVFTIKSDGSKRARLVAKWFQEEVCNNVYSPVARMPTIRLLISTAFKEKWEIKQLDIPTAFLNAELETETFIKIPQGVISDKVISDQVKSDGVQVLKLNKSLYGLKSAPKLWNKKLDNFLVKQNLKRSCNDFCFYYGKEIYFVVWVDDIILLG